MRFAIVGCGYVADFYMSTLASHTHLELAGVYDRNPERLKAFAAYHGLKAYGSLEELLGDATVPIVANLTNPSSHYAVSRAALEAGKHVYSEKPLALEIADAEALVALAEAKKLFICSAPCTVLSETAQTVWKALRDGRIGTPRLVYAELDDGNVARMDYANWISDSGVAWPAKDEFEVGCTLEHAGYYLTWLTAFFGPAKRITSHAHILLPDKGIPLDIHTNDYATACIEFHSGVTARITCSIYGSHDHRFRVFGDEGTLSVDKAWDYGAPVYATRRGRWTSRAEKYPTLAALVGLGPKKIPLVKKRTFKVKTRGSRNPMDFPRGIAELANAVSQGRAPRLSARWSLHVNELALAMQHPERYGATRELKTTFEPMNPMDWAQ